MVFQYRMTDYSGTGDTGKGRVGGIISNSLQNLTYSKIIGIDIFDRAGNEFKFDVEVYAQYKAGGKNINNITKSMLASYNSNPTITSGFAGGGRRRYLSELNDFSLPEIDNF